MHLKVGCIAIVGSQIEMPEGEILKFKDFEHEIKSLFVIYSDFERVTKKSWVWPQREWISDRDIYECCSLGI